VFTLLTGTTIAQALPVAIAPILTRIYTPDDFGIFALYMAAASIISVVATGRYELAIMLPEKDNDAINIVVLSMTVAVAVSMLTLAIVFLFNQPITHFFGNPEIGKWLYFIPLTVLLTGAYQSLNYWSNRKKLYRHIAISSVAQSGASATANIGMGIGGMATGGLVMSRLVGQGTAIAVLGRMIWREDKAHLKNINRLSCFALSKKYYKFPIYSTVGAFLDIAASQMPIFILSKFFHVAEVGFFGFTFKVLNLPLALIAKAISQVLFQKISQSKTNDTYALVIKMFINLVVMALPLVLFFFFFGEIVFTLVFGEKWRIAGIYAHILVFAVAFRFIVSPLSVVMMLDQHIKMGMLWQVIYFITITITLLLVRNLDIITFLWVFVIHEISLYLLYFYFISNSAKKTKRCVG